MKLQYKQVLLGAQRARAVRIVRRIMGECDLLWSPSSERGPLFSIRSQCSSPLLCVGYEVHHHDGQRDSLPTVSSLPGTVG